MRAGSAFLGSGQYNGEISIGRRHSEEVISAGSCFLLLLFLLCYHIQILTVRSKDHLNL